MSSQYVVSCPRRIGKCAKHEQSRAEPCSIKVQRNAIKNYRVKPRKIQSHAALPQEHKMLQNYNVILGIYVAFMIYSNSVVHRRRRRHRRSHRYRCHSRSSRCTLFFFLLFALIFSHFYVILMLIHRARMWHIQERKKQIPYS